MVKALETVEQVIENLGGQRAVAELTNAASTSVVPTWKYRKRFPAKTFPTIQTALHERGLSAPNKLWGIDVPAEVESAR